MQTDICWDSELKQGLPIISHRREDFQVTIEPRVAFIFVALWKKGEHLISKRLDRDADSEEIFSAADELIQEIKKPLTAGKQNQ